MAAVLAALKAADFLVVPATEPEADSRTEAFPMIITEVSPVVLARLTVLQMSVSPPVTALFPLVPAGLTVLPVAVSLAAAFPAVTAEDFRVTSTEDFRADHRTG